MKRKTVLVVDDDQVFNALLVRQITDFGFGAVGAPNWTVAKDLLDRELEPDLVLLDFKLPDADANAVVRELAGQYPVVVLTGYGSIRNAVAVIRAGAADYLTKPVDLEDLELTLRRELENAALRRSNAYYRRQLSANRDGHLIGSSKEMDEVRAMVEAVAPTDATVLVQGESGTGKELAARAIHALSPRRDRELVTVDSATLAEVIFESELFGHEKGAFTSADRQKKGLIEAADGGTLFLDEIGEVSAPNQAKLLRLLETGTFRRVGGTKTLSVDVRFVVATNRDLPSFVRDGRFRGDLYFRLSSFVLSLPPLRGRPVDIAALAEHFLHHLARGVRKDLSPAALDALAAYAWPGNARELRNVIERAIILSGQAERIDPQHLGLLPQAREAPSGGVAFAAESTLENLERDYVRFVLARHGGNRSRTAQTLGISERNVYRLIKQWNLS